MRSKEEANDYRYFPDPDLLPVEIEDRLIAEVLGAMPELPDAKRRRFREDYGLSELDADLLTTTRAQADYFEAVAQICGDAKLAANWVMVELAGALNRAGLDITDSPVTAAALGGLLQRIQDQTISGKIAKQVFDAMWQGAGSADSVIAGQGLQQITDRSAIEAVVDQVISDNPKQREQYRAGKEKLLGFFVGQVMKATQGKANPGQVNQLLKQKLAS
jgi:aspartyl-tRNA(Asn)/glutamyl-tRNA(Gln) amidotransferase subunit B